jgi:E3 ubiquitin-protein ligase NEDD4
MERQRHNARMLPEDRPSTNASSTSLETSTQASTTPSQTPSQGNGPATNGILPLQHSATTAGNGPLPSGWG